MKRWMCLFLAAVMLISGMPLNALASEVTADTVVSLRIAALPDKVKYLPGETLDLTGLLAEAAYSSGAVMQVMTEELTVEAPAALESGDHAVSISYEGQTASFDIHVHTVRVLEALAPTYRETGLTEGADCEACGDILQPQEVLPVLDAPELGTPEISLRVTDDGVELFWNAVESAEYYQVYRKSGGEWTLLDTVTGTDYLDDAADYGVTLSYTVRACLQTADGVISGSDAAEKSAFFVGKLCQFFNILNCTNFVISCHY